MSLLRWIEYKTSATHTTFGSSSPPPKSRLSILEFRRWRRLPCSLIRSKSLNHPVQLNIKILFVGFPTLEVGSDSGPYFVRQDAQIPLFSEHVAVKVQRYQLANR